MKSFIAAGIMAGALVASPVAADTPSEVAPERTCDVWPGDGVRLVPARLVGQRVDTVVGHDTFVVRRCDGYSTDRGSSFVISKNDGAIAVS